MGGGWLGRWGSVFYGLGLSLSLGCANGDSHLGAPERLDGGLEFRHELPRGVATFLRTADIGDGRRDGGIDDEDAGYDEDGGADTPHSARAGVALTFDDHSLDSWWTAHQQVLQPRGIVATFCLSYIDNQRVTEMRKLAQLVEAGHGVCNHGLRHVYADQFVPDNGVESYIEQEVLPAIDAMDALGYSTRSFAIPGGADTPESNLALAGYFDLIRDVSYGDVAPPPQPYFFDFDDARTIVGALSTDVRHERGPRELRDALQLALDHDQVMIFYGHKIEAEGEPDSLVTTYANLQAIADFVDTHGMRYYRLDELAAVSAADATR